MTSGSGGSKGEEIRAVLNDKNAMFEEEEDTPLMVNVSRSQLRAAVQAQSGEVGLSDVRIRMLTDEQLSALYLIAGSNASDKQVQAQAIVN